jgi:hypothetical protein
MRISGFAKMIALQIADELVLKNSVTHDEALGWLLDSDDGIEFLRSEVNRRAKRSSSKGSTTIKTFNEALADAAGDEADDADDDDSDIPDTLIDDVLRMHEGQMTRAEALEWLTGHPLGREVARQSREKRGDDTMSTEKIVAEFKKKRLAELQEWSITKMATAAIAAPDALMLDEHEFTALVAAKAQREHPGLSKSQAFAKMFTASDETGTLLRRAHAVIKAMPIITDYTDVKVTSQDDSQEAIRQLREVGARKWPSLTEAQQFARAMTDPENASLAQRAHQRPSPPAAGAYPFPRV